MDASPDSRPLPDETLMRLAEARVASHVLRFSDAVLAAASLDDEVAALEALSEMLSGPIYRLAPLTYAFALDAEPTAFAKALAVRLGGCEPPEIAALPTAAGDGPKGDALTLLGAFVADEGALPAGRRVVIDARHAIAAADLTAERIAAHADAARAETSAAVAALETRIAAQASADAERLDRIDAALAVLAERAEPAPAVETDRLERIEASLAALAERAEPAPAVETDRLERIEARLAALAERAEPAPAGTDPAVAARLSAIEAALGGVLAALEPQGAAVDAAAVLEQVRALADRPVATIDFHREREGLSRLSVALQTLVARLDGETARLVDARAAAPAGDLAPVLERLDEVESALRGDAAGAALAAIREDLRALAARPAATVDLGAERAAITELSETLRAAVTRLTEQPVADPRAVLERLDALAGEVRGLADRPVAAAGVVESLDLKRERDALNRLAFSLQTAASRLDGEISRLIAADLGAGGDGDAGALAETLAPIADALARLEGAAALGADNAAELTEVVRAVREECAALHDLHARALDAAGARQPAEEMMDRVSATLAEFLARMERIEAQRGAQAGRPALLAPRLGRPA